MDIANESFALSEKISEEKLVRKVLRSVPKRFDMKVIAIEEAHHIATMKVDELFGSMCTFKMSFDDKSDKKSKSIALQSIIENDAPIVKIKKSDENLAQSISLLAKKFGKALRQWDKRGGSQGNHVSPNVQDNNSPNNHSNPKSSRLFERKLEYVRGLGSNQGLRDKNSDVENVRDLTITKLNVQTF